MKRPFFIIYHNPNRIGKADDKNTAIYALTHGANALGPDVVFHKGILRIHHHNNPFDRIDNAPLLSEYLDQLASALQNNPSLHLFLIAFDIKNTDDEAFPFEKMQIIIQDHFSSKVSGVHMVFTTPDDFEFLLKHVRPYLLPGQAFGTDEFDNPVEAHQRLKDSGHNYIYSHGNSTIFNNLYKPIAEAVALRNSINSFELVYPWVIDTKHSFRRYLNLGVDGIMTNKPEVLKELIEKEYSDKYQLAGPAFDKVLAD